MANIAGIATITRAESRARRGLPPDQPPAPPALPTSEVEIEVEVVDAELVPEHEPPLSPRTAAVGAVGHPDRTDAPGDGGAAPAAPAAPPPRTLTYEEAAAVMRASRVETRPAGTTPGLATADANRRARVLRPGRVPPRRGAANR